jgi:ketosteroid isomerase-like protein
MKLPPAASSNITLLRGLYDAFAVGDVAAVLSKFDPNIIWNEAENFPYADKNPYLGPEAILHGVFARCMSEWDGFAVAIDELLDAGDTIIALGRYHGTCKATGRKQHTQLVHVYRISGGKITRFQQYADTLQVAKVMGRA